MKTSNRVRQNHNTSKTQKQTPNGAQVAGHRVDIRVKTGQLAAAERRAKALGRTLNEHVLKLVEKDLAAEQQERRILDALGLGSDEREALAIICGTYSESPAQYIRNALLDRFSNDGDTMRKLAKSDFDRDSQWAKPLIHALRPVFERIAMATDEFRMPQFEDVGERPAETKLS